MRIKLADYFQLPNIKCICFGGENSLLFVNIYIQEITKILEDTVLSYGP
jgi:hypothetical protein